MKKRIAVLAGDGIGPEVMAEAIRVLLAVAGKFGHSFELTHALVGGAAFEESGSHFPEESRRICETSDAVLFGSVGGPVSESLLPKWKDCERNSILAIRKTFNFQANLRPAKVYPELVDACPLKASVIEAGVDLLVVRELIGGIYFGEHKTYQDNGSRHASDLAVYSEEQIRDIAHVAFKAARGRRNLVTSVDKANVLDTSKLWRVVVHEVAAEYSDVELRDMLVDNCAMQLIRNPSQFDVLLADNLMGDILSDEASVLPGSLGLSPSASFNKEGFGLYEPSGGSAPDIAGQGIANPIAQILSAALMLRYSFSLEKEASAIESAVEAALQAGYRTRDIFCEGTILCSTREMGEKILEAIG